MAKELAHSELPQSKSDDNKSDSTSSQEATIEEDRCMPLLNGSGQIGQDSRSHSEHWGSLCQSHRQPSQLGKRIARRISGGSTERHCRDWSVGKSAKSLYAGGCFLRSSLSDSTEVIAWTSSENRMRTDALTLPSSRLVETPWIEWSWNASYFASRVLTGFTRWGVIGVLSWEIGDPVFWQIVTPSAPFW